MSLFGDEITSPDLEADEGINFDHANDAAGLQPAAQSTLCLGFDDLEREFLELIAQQKVPHGVILSGPRGIGKATFAYRLARALFKYPPPRDSAMNDMFGAPAPPAAPANLDVSSEDPIFRQVASGGHPDFRYLSAPEGKKALDIDTIRTIGPFLSLQASEGGWRVVIIDDANTMTNQAQNALLKILEEPPPQTVLILIAHRDGAFLPTIRSRCRRYVCKAPRESEFEQILKLSDPAMKQGDLDILYRLAEGSPGRALEFYEHELLEVVPTLGGLLSAYPNIDFEQVHLFAERFARGHEEALWQGFSETLLMMVRDAVFSKARGAVMDGPLALSAFTERLQLEQLLVLCDKLEQHLREIDLRALDRRLGVIEAFMILDQSL